MPSGFLPRLSKTPGLCGALAGLVFGLMGLQATAAPPSETAPPPAEASAPPITPPAQAKPAPKVAPRPKPATTPAPDLPVASAVPASAADIEAFTDSVIPALMKRDHVLGTTVAIVQGGKPLLIKGYGYDRLSPARATNGYTSLFRIGSITKTFTWIVARQEIEAGRIKLDGPIADYLPPDIYREDRRYKPLRMRDLMAHTTGYEDTSLGHLFQLDPTHLQGTDSYLRRHTPMRVRDRGQFSSYSNFGAALAAMTVVQTSKARDVPGLMEARIFKPLGLNHTTLREPYDPQTSLSELPTPMSRDLAAKLSSGFLWDGATWQTEPFDHSIAMSGALGASSTAADMSRYMALLLGNGQLDGVQIFGPSSANAFRSPLLKLPKGYNGWASGFVMREHPSGVMTYGHGGATLWFNANMILVPELDIGIYVAANTQTGEALTEAYPDLLLAHLKGESPNPAPLRPGSDMSYGSHRAYYDAIAGQYASTRRAYSGLEGAITRLINTVDVDFDTNGRMILSSGDGMAAYVPAGTSGFFLPEDRGNSGTGLNSGSLRVAFKPEGGKAVAFETSSNMTRYERIGWVHNPQTLGGFTKLVLVSCLVVLVGLTRQHHQNNPTEAQTRAAWLSYTIAFMWLLAIWAFSDWRAGLGSDPSSLFINWPSGMVRMASGLAFLAALGTALQFALMFWVWQDAQYYTDGWSLTQKIGHTALMAFWALYSLVLVMWGALTWWS
ncbi:serine hydrolase [Asticcacaulis sp. SL142]|uniref:serine hydrolase domain-containing protein n=1 Tax=Asticcacaulis sp. SL142 TaxID=2995155 RepID=UPI00226D3C9E|nr:serine hydrolase domain-containing protein [Asticcacaulis sp. SL142]WAC48045.1 serine hydrolase [Asticcacaulis sp. SL142]